MTKIVCPRCEGACVVKRTKEEDGTEADTDIHPIMSQTPKTCPKCGGAGSVEAPRA